ncbi:hypothetical protein A8L34_21360 [Bacillus sp. FJAT-27264]|uniref:O-antigen ligase family protein n=1 Tax=Paenibacillus sp. (strain DSM 101736 / FJAT-27264) TaxID=1850362 RepID=UPI000807DC08|nr:O-antigen ligase family protein [Bacillus sp. FJAT-27264]OBZ09821.1 hypothetical protein A8L34_21360 [Bacillus sp. FJAT-27264]
MLLKNDKHLLLSLGILTFFAASYNINFLGSSLSVSVGEFVFLGALFFYFLGVLSQKRKIYVNTVAGLLLSISLVGFFSVINAFDYGRFLVGFFNYIEAALIFIFIINLQFSDKSLRTMFMVYILSAGVLSIRIIFQTYFVNNGNFIIGNKIAMDVGGSNYLASLLLLPLIMSLTLLMQAGKAKSIIFYLIMMVMLSTSIVFTGSRTALLILAVLVPMFFISDIVQSKQPLRQKILNIVVVLIGTGLAYRFFEEFIKQMIVQGRFENLIYQSNVTARYTIFTDYFKAFLNHPFLGNGFMNVQSQGILIWAHNSFLQIFADAGVLAGCLFIALILVTFKSLKAILMIVQDKFLRSCIVGYRRGFFALFLHGLFEPNFGTKLFMVYVFIGLALVFVSYRIMIQSTHPNGSIDKSELLVMRLRKGIIGIKNI